MEEKYTTYKQLLHHRNFLAFYIGIPSAIVLIFCNLFNLPIWIAGIFMGICAYVTMFWFLAKNTCPWCYEPFFLYTSKGYADGGDMLFQNKCINCYRPNRNDIV